MAWPVLGMGGEEKSWSAGNVCMRSSIHAGFAHVKEWLREIFFFLKKGRKEGTYLGRKGGHVGDPVCAWLCAFFHLCCICTPERVVRSENKKKEGRAYVCKEGVSVWVGMCWGEVRAPFGRGWQGLLLSLCGAN